MQEDYLRNLKHLFNQYKTLAEKTLAQVDEAKLGWQYNEDSNSIAVIIKHLSGNILSRWTDFLTTDGEKPNRNRDNEFINEPISKAALLNQWNTAWDCLFDTLSTLDVNDLEKTIYIRNEPHTVIAALNRQLTHCAYHVGQIVYLGKMLCNDNWQSLSIPKNGSESFNQQMFRDHIPTVNQKNKE